MHSKNHCATQEGKESTRNPDLEPLTLYWATIYVLIGVANLLCIFIMIYFHFWFESALCFSLLAAIVVYFNDLNQSQTNIADNRTLK